MKNTIAKINNHIPNNISLENGIILINESGKANNMSNENNNNAMPITNLNAILISFL